MVDVAHKSQRSASALTPESRIAFPFVHEKRTKTAAGAVLKSPRHDAVVLLPKLDPDATKCANYNLLAGLCMEAANRAWGSWPQGGKWPIADGDIPYVSKPKPGVAPLTQEQIVAKNVWRKGHWIVEVSHNLDPGPRVCVLQNGVAVEIPAKTINGVTYYKSGDYGFVSLYAWSYQRETFGVNLGFEGILFSRPGEPIGSTGARSASQMFGSVAGTAAPMALPVPGAAPPAPAAQGYAAPGPTTGAPQPAAPTAAYVAPPPAPPAPPAPTYSAPVPGASGLPPFPQPAR